MSIRKTAWHMLKGHVLPEHRCHADHMPLGVRRRGWTRSTGTASMAVRGSVFSGNNVDCGTRNYGTRLLCGLLQLLCSP